MIKLTFTAFVLLFTAASLNAQVEGPAKEKYPKSSGTLAIDPLKYVNPFVGTGGHGHTFPGPVVPFGMVQPGPDTRYEGWDGCSGYHYSDSIIYGFSQTHLSGTGIPDYSDLLVIPQTGKVKTTGKFKDPKGYGARFVHQNEAASPGFYSVTLENPQIDVRLTATKRCAIHEYTFGTKKGKRYIVLDLGYRDKVLDAGATVKNNTEVSGFRVSQAWAEKQSFFFDLQTSVPFAKSKLMLDRKKGKYIVILEFPEKINSVMLRIGISGTDEAGAANNLQAEANHWDFNKYLKDAQNAWRTQLSAVQFTTQDKEVTSNFYTALYHAYIHPSVWTDADGRYRDFKNVVRSSENGDMYSVFSIWDTYRGANPLYTILQPKLATQIIESYYQQYLDMGTLPMWTLSNNETYCMIGYHAASVIADAYKKGIPVRNPSELLNAMIATSNYDHFGIVPYTKNGFIAANEEAESVSKTLEYAYDDWAISEFARAIGNDSVANIYARRAESWQNIYNPESGFFQAREGGMWLNNFRPNEVNHHFTEANAWQYSLAVPHNISNLTKLRGGKMYMEFFLDTLFRSSSEMSGREQADITGLIGQYAHGNEPSHHMAYLYNYVSSPHKTQELLDRIMREHYHNLPDGLSGNEDCGQMSAWYVLSSMGFYPVCPGSPTYAIGRPLMDQLSIKTEKGIFGIEVLGNSKENMYIQSVQWNGEPYRKLYLDHKMIATGGLLTIVMGPKPNFDLQTYSLDLAGNVRNEVIAAPYFDAPGKVFSESVVVEMEKLPGERGTIYYTTDGSDPSSSATVKSYDKPFSLYETTVVKACIRREGKRSNGPVVETKFVKFLQDKTISVSPQSANQYSGGSKDALIDGQDGGLDYRSVGWQGFQSEYVISTISLNDPKQVSKVTVNALQDTKSWIFYPKSFTVEVSDDGTDFKKVGTVTNKIVSDKLTGTVIKPMQLEFPPVKAKFVRVKIDSYGVCPDWHLGAGGKTWIFMDEITVE